MRWPESRSSTGQRIGCSNYAILGCEDLGIHFGVLSGRRSERESERVVQPVAIQFAERQVGTETELCDLASPERLVGEHVGDNCWDARAHYGVCGPCPSVVDCCSTLGKYFVVIKSGRDEHSAVG